ncbi:hypothetical protein K435DRAFT_66617 [Dendrothele bispora CBS 962.96]|uniref:Uncharacterized protein n=1 Tax=Dendrothele bispora (strain CBS 962.96) TaxID=1314807 RepID=A0A4S8M5C5_DENBC|nr:hypothetical protein K435DRAFT_66617 [Dendrothele bispora CBS 962.96]
MEFSPDEDRTSLTYTQYPCAGTASALISILGELYIHLGYDPGIEISSGRLGSPPSLQTNVTVYPYPRTSETRYFECMEELTPEEGEEGYQWPDGEYQCRLCGDTLAYNSEELGDNRVSLLIEH